MFGVKKSVFILLITLFSINLISTVFASDMSQIAIHAGASSVFANVVDRYKAGAGKAESVAEVASILISENRLKNIYGTDLSSDEPLYDLYGYELVMSDVDDSVNVRSLPSEDSDVVGKLYHACAGCRLDEKDGWTQIKSGDVTGWVRNDYILDGQEAVDLARQAGATVATVETDILRIRESADEDSSIYGFLGKGEKIEVIEETDGWIKVGYSDETEGYISGDFVSLDYEIDEGETIEVIRAREEAKRAAEKAEAERKRKIEASRTKETKTTNNGGVSASTDDVTLLAALIQAECGREAYPGKLAVGAVVVNRAKGRYGSIYNAVFAPGQFGPAASGKVAAIVAMGPSAECRKAASEAISGVSNVGSATHFRNINSSYAGTVIGNHVFW